MTPYQIVYRSTAKSHFTDAELKDLLVQARAFNHAQRITGILLYSEGQFVQVMEGDETVVRALYERICQDPRHTHVDTLSAGPVPRSMFPDWSMGFATVAAPEFAWLAGYIDTHKTNFLLPRAHAFSEEIRELLFDFVKGQLVS